MAKKDARVAFDEARQALAAARLDDPDDHFPYKLDEALDLDLDAPAGFGGPDDSSRRVGDYFDHDIARASAAYVDAQAAYLRDPGDGTRAAYESTRDALVEVRRRWRVAKRRDGFWKFIDEAGNYVPPQEG